MIKPEPKIFPLGDNALTISFGNVISPEINKIAVNLAEYFQNNPFAGFIETVPAYSSVTVFYDVFEVKLKFPQFTTAFEAVKNMSENALVNLVENGREKHRLIEIPVSFAKDAALDLEFIASTKNLRKNEVIEIFTSRTYRVYMLGFLPGFAYMGEVDERIALPRKESPRKKVPRGSVGIAGRQTGIYSLDSPGGWQIIGRTEVEQFAPEKENPTYLQAGDSIKFTFLENG